MKLRCGGLNFPTSLAFAPDGRLFVAESGLAFDGAAAGGRVLEVVHDGSVREVCRSLRAPVNGLVWHAGSLIVAEGGSPGRIGRLDPDNGSYTTILDGLPGFGNYHTCMAVPGPDGKLYFTQGALTNSGVIGEDSGDLAWLRDTRHDCDLPGFAVGLADLAFPTCDAQGKQMHTGPFARFGNTHPPGTRLAASLPCTAAVMRCNLDGSDLELVAWGLRNGYGLGFLPDGRLIATEQGSDVRGSRPVWHCPDFLYEIRHGAWYGWPDFMGGVAIHDARHAAPDGTTQAFLLTNHAELPAPETPLLAFEVNACATKFALFPPGSRFAGQLLLTQFGDERPMTAPTGPKVGRKLVRIDPQTWSVHPLALSLPEAMALARPIDVAFSPDGQSCCVLDFGEFEFTSRHDYSARRQSGNIIALSLGGLEEMAG